MERTRFVVTSHAFGLTITSVLAPPFPVRAVVMIQPAGLGGSPAAPKSKTLGTMAVPKCRNQMWLTATRAATGFSRAVSHRARASRRPLETLP